MADHPTYHEGMRRLQDARDTRRIADRLSEVTLRHAFTDEDRGFIARCPLFFVGKAGGALKGNRHLKAEDGTPMANAMLAALNAIGVDINQFGDSTKAMDLNVVQS